MILISFAIKYVSKKMDNSDWCTRTLQCFFQTHYLFFCQAVKDLYNLYAWTNIIQVDCLEKMVFTDYLLSVLTINRNCVQWSSQQLCNRLLNILLKLKYSMFSSPKSLQSLLCRVSERRMINSRWRLSQGMLARTSLTWIHSVVCIQGCWERW